MPTGFENQEFRADVRHMPNGVIRIYVRLRQPQGRSNSHRQLAAFIYEVAAELESRSDEVRGARWAISPAASDGRIDVELDEEDDGEAAKRIVSTTMAPRKRIV